MPIEPLVLSSPAVGTQAAPLALRAEREWLMAYAAALGDTAPRRLDTTRDGGIEAHPLFPVCPEWPAWLQVLRDALAPAMLERGVHATHELLYRRPVRCDEALRVDARIVASRQRRSGLHLTTRLRTLGDDGGVVFESRAGLLLRGVTGDDAGEDTDSNADLLPARSFAGAGPARWTASRDVAAGLAHVYTACARIWNPIHTDLAVAARAGLDDIILHGTATLALALSEVERREAHGRHPRRIAARFLAPVTMPGTLRIDCFAAGPADDAIAFRVHAGADATAVCIGTVSFFDD